MNAGILIGGRATRMGRVKGLIEIKSGTTILDHLVAITRQVGLTPVLLGACRETEARYPELPRLDDAAPGVGPIGGLLALLRAAEQAGSPSVILLGCDLPHLTVKILDQLLAAPPAPLVAARKDGRWQPLCARYEVAACLPVVERLVRDGRHALQAVCDAARAAELPLSTEDHAALVDWDSPEDVQ